jgi:hypothetical protein
MKSSELAIQTTIFLMSDGTALVLYMDGRLGILKNGGVVGDPWNLGDLPRCVAKFRELARLPTIETAIKEGKSPRVRPAIARE